MGHRANYVIKSGSTFELYYSHWGANVVHLDMFWGPKQAQEFIRNQRPVQAWLDEIWCEGGALLDLDERRLQLFGGEDLQYDASLRQVYLQLANIAWPEWQVRWADRGLLDFANLLGIPREAVISTKALKSPQRDEEWGPLLEASSPDRDWSRTLIEVLEDRFYTLTDPPENVLLTGPKLLKGLPCSEPYLLPEEWPQAGLLLSPSSRNLVFWTLDAHPLMEEWVNEVWSGWTVERKEDKALDQISRLASSINCPGPSPDDSLQVLTRSLKRQVRDRSESVELIAQRVSELAEAGGQVEVNSLALQDVRPSMEASDRSTFLDKVIREYKNTASS